MRLVLMGPPGCGKGTQADLLAEKFAIPKISSGDLFRADPPAPAADLGVKSHLDAGTLVPDEKTIAVVAARLARPDAAGGFVLDGFPRTLPQAEALKALLETSGLTLDGVLEIHLSSDEIIRRLSGRRTCRACDRIWHLTFNPAPNGQCGDCGGELFQRADDEPATISRRLDVYVQQTLPVVAHYRAAGRMATIDGSGPVEVVHQNVMKALAPIIR